LSAGELRQLFGGPTAPSTAAEPRSREPSVLGRRTVICGTAAEAVTLHETEALRRDLAQDIDHAGMSEASVDDWEHTVDQYGQAQRYRPAADLLADLTADFVELRRQLERRRAILVPNRLARVMALMAGLMCATLVRLDQSAARNWARLAKIIASEAGDSKLHTWVLSEEAYAHYYSGNIAEALHVAGHAQQVAGQAPCSGLATAITLEAVIQAKLGRVTETNAALDRLEHTVGRLEPHERTWSIFGYDEAVFNGYIGRVHTLLGNTTTALAPQERALELYPAGEYTGRAMVGLDRADCLIRDHEIPAAAEYATQTLQTIGTDYRNPMIDNRARQVLHHIPATATDLPAVRELRDVLQATR
jgi:tetratricopeptide (TPR) repeat protein